MSVILFGDKIDLINSATPSTGEHIIAYDLDGVLKQKDEFGVIIPIGSSGSYIQDLDSVLNTGNTASIPIFMTTNNSIIDTSTNNGIYFNAALGLSNSSSLLELGTNLKMINDNISIGQINGTISNSKYISINVDDSTDSLISIGFGNSDNILMSTDQGILNSSKNVDKTGTIISSKNSYIDSGVVNSVIIGGSNTIAVNNDTVYLSNNVTINNSYTLPNFDGSPGNFLVTNGTGVLTWSSGNNFATSNLIFDNNRIHSTNGYTYSLSTDGSNESYHTISPSFNLIGWGSNYRYYTYNDISDWTNYKQRTLITSANYIINDVGEPFNFIVRGTTNQNLIYANATTNRIGIGTASPSETLDVFGGLKTKSLIITDGAIDGYVLTTDSNGLVSWTQSIATDLSSVLIAGNSTLGNDIILSNGDSLKNTSLNTFLKLDDDTAIDGSKISMGVNATSSTQFIMYDGVVLKNISTGPSSLITIESGTSKSYILSDGLNTVNETCDLISYTYDISDTILTLNEFKSTTQYYVNIIGTESSARTTISNSYIRDSFSSLTSSLDYHVDLDINGLKMYDGVISPSTNILRFNNSGLNIWKDIYLEYTPASNNTNNKLLSRNVSTGKIELVDTASFSTIYTSNGSITDPIRTITTNANTLLISGSGTGETFVVNAVNGTVAKFVASGVGTALYTERGSGFSIHTIGKQLIEQTNTGVNSDSALFEVNSTNLGVLIPRMTSTQKEAISIPAHGLLVYDTVNNRIEGWNNTYWAGSKRDIFIQHAGAWSPADAQSVAFGQMPVVPISTAIAGVPYRIILRGSGTIRACQFYSYAGGVAGSNEAWSLYIRLNDTTDYLVETVSTTSAERIFVNTGLNIPFVDGDNIRMKFVNPTWVTNPTGVGAAGYIIIE